MNTFPEDVCVGAVVTGLNRGDRVKEKTTEITDSKKLRLTNCMNVIM